MQRNLLPVLLVAVLLASCSETASPIGDNGTDDSTTKPASLHAYGLADGIELPLDVDAAEAEYGRLRAEMLDILRADEPLAVRVRRLRSFLRAHKDFPLRPYLAQNAAIEVLGEALSLPDHAALDHVDFYTKVLIDNGSPESALIARSLERLQGRWSTQQIRRAARLTIDQAVTWAEKVCTTCSRAGKESAGAARADVAGLALKRRGILEGVDDLRRMAGP